MGRIILFMIHPSHGINSVNDRIAIYNAFISLLHLYRYINPAHKINFNEYLMRLNYILANLKYKNYILYPCTQPAEVITISVLTSDPPQQCFPFRSREIGYG